LVELTQMRDRINSVRQRIASADRRLAFIGGQYGMFSMLPLSKDQVLKLREDHSIYMADSGRFNVVGMGDHQIDRFIAAVADALGSGMGLAGGYSDGRDIGVVFNYPNPGGAHALPMCGGVGAQYTPSVGWAQAIVYKHKVLGEGPPDAISLVLGGDASCATG